MSPSPSSQAFKVTSRVHGMSPSASSHGMSPLLHAGGHDMISTNSQFFYIYILQICKTRFKNHLACSFKNKEGHRYHYLVQVFS